MGCGASRTQAKIPTKAFGTRDFELYEQWAPDCRKHYEKGEYAKYLRTLSDAPQANNGEIYVPPPRGTMDFAEDLRIDMDQLVPRDEATQKFLDLVDTTEMKTGGTEFHPQAGPAQDSLLHKVKSWKGTEPRACMIYFHGGGGVAGTPKQHERICARYAVECDAIVLNCQYRLAPECPAPGALYDAVAAIKHVIAKAADLGVDTKRICIFGENGGGWVTAGAALVLAQANEGNLIRFHMPMLPMLSDYYWKKSDNFVEDYKKQDWTDFTGQLSSYLQVQFAQGPTTKAFTELWFKDYQTAKDNMLIFPNRADAATVKKMPMAVVLTTEFDTCRPMAEEAAKLYKENGRLIELGVLRGSHHGHFFNYSLSTTDAWFAAIARVVKCYLC